MAPPRRVPRQSISVGQVFRGDYLCPGTGTATRMGDQKKEPAAGDEKGSALRERKRSK